MKRFFLATLATIVSITAIIILIVGVDLISQYSKAEKLWREQAYEDYVAFIEGQLTAENLNRMMSSMSNFELNLHSFPNDRITGILFRNAKKNVFFGIGKTPQGFDVVMQPSDELTQYDDRERRTCTDTLFDIVCNGTSAQVETSIRQAEINFMLPPNVSDSNIVGSVTFNLNGAYAGTVYVLAHTPRTYSYSGSVINRLIGVLLWSVVYALLISLALAWVFSYRNTKMVNSIRSSLKTLTEPDHETLKLPKGAKDPFIGQIFSSIQELDRNLAENQRNRAEWLRTISHDLNTPVSSLKIMLEGIQDGIFSLNDPAVLKTLTDETKTLESRIKAVNDYSRLQAMTNITMEKIDCAYLVEEVKHCLPDDFADRIRYNIETPAINGNRTLIVKACCELLANCRDADPGGESVAWTISSDGKSCTMTFENRGNLKQNVDFFEPWERGDWARHEGGSGMGLPIVATIIQRLHRGTARIEQSGEIVKATISWPC
ncbi:MAG: sensor histidine kinase [Sphaerochaetaceae bacterium]